MTTPELTSPATEPVALPATEIFLAAFEHAGSRGDNFLPAGLVATDPTLVTLLAVRAPDGPVGPFTFAQVRVSCRSGARGRALAVATAVDAAPDVATWLSSAWAIGGEAATVAYERRYHHVHIAAPWFDVELEGPRPIGQHDVQYVTGLHPVSTQAGERLVQVELHADLDRVERGRPVLHGFTAPGPAAGLNPSFPVAATSSVGTLTLPTIRFLLQPDIPAPRGTERVGEAVSAT